MLKKLKALLRSKFNKTGLILSARECELKAFGYKPYTRRMGRYLILNEKRNSNDLNQPAYFEELGISYRLLYYLKSMVISNIFFFPEMEINIEFLKKLDLSLLPENKIDKILQFVFGEIASETGCVNFKLKIEELGTKHIVTGITYFPKPLINQWF